ncbi:hypothetical protein ABDD95_16925 [Mucilaginibacter sp. PAMB04274]|uniref:hypothetical protein n=1 Tax=Mucilaginibacter sp. PAMB04274 TaxID=3138568 RepID=UPI0031F66F1F
MKTYLVSTDPDMFNAVVSVLKQQGIAITKQMDVIGILSVSCRPDQKAIVEQIPGVMAVEEEGTSFAL